MFSRPKERSKMGRVLIRYSVKLRWKSLVLSSSLRRKLTIMSTQPQKKLRMKVNIYAEEGLLNMKLIK